MLEGGGHKNWEIEYAQWLYNDSFNVLHLAEDQNRLTRLLQKLVLEHDDLHDEVGFLGRLVDELQQLDGRVDLRAEALQQHGALVAKGAAYERRDDPDFAHGHL